jgi:two-component system sensor histidine kinase/response regulator
MPKQKILAVDDDALNLAILEELLAEEYDLTTAQSGAEALELAERVRPDLVLLDIMMPDFDGYEACRQLRRRENLKHTKVVLVSAKAMVAERLRGYEAGADDYVTKPFDHSELLAKVKVFLRLKFMEEMDALKSEFLVLVAHETRTPLTKLLLMSEMLGGDVPLGEEERKVVARMMRDTSEQLRALFDRGMQYCLLRTGQARLRRCRFDAAHLLRETASVLRGKAELLEASLEVEAEGMAPLESDHPSVQLVMRLLLESALERGGRGGRVSALLRAETDGGVLLEIRSPGRGSDAVAVHLLLEPFRTPDVKHHTSGGALDLPLAAELMRHLQGALSVDALPEGVLSVQARFPGCVDADGVGWEGEDEGLARAA